MIQTLLALCFLLPGVLRFVQPAASLPLPAEALQADTGKLPPTVQTGVASYYHSRFQGRPTASGQRYDEQKLTAAHNTLSFGTRIRVTNLRNNRSVIFTVNDRMHHNNKRLVDLSRAAAVKLGYVSRGLTKVRVEILKD